MIKSFRNQKLRRFFEKGDRKQVNQDFAGTVERLLDLLDAAAAPEQMNFPGSDFHPLKGKPKRYSVHVNGNFCITFEWAGEDAIRVDLEDYH